MRSCLKWKHLQEDNGPVVTFPRSGKFVEGGGIIRVSSMFMQLSEQALMGSTIRDKMARHAHSVNTNQTSYRQKSPTNNSFWLHTVSSQFRINICC